MSLNIVGISAHFHDAACCLLQDGELTAAAQEERFSRVKHDPHLPVQAFRYCLRQAGLELPDLSAVAYYEDPIMKAARQLWMAAADPRASWLASKIDPGRVEYELRDGLGYDGPVLYFEHHQSHAASSYYFSGFSDAAILTVDGVGEWATTTYGRAAEGAITLFDDVQFPDSLGLLYSTITSYLGFDVNDAEYKVMGLAPYGQPCYVNLIGALIEDGADGQYRLNLRYFDFSRPERMYAPALVDLFGQAPRLPESDIRTFHRDLARSLQVVLEEMLLDKVRYLHARVGGRRLCFAGGVALNCVANGRLRRDGPFAEIFVQPAAGDAGGCLGAAALAHRRLAGHAVPCRQLDRVDLGPAFSNAEVRRVLDAAAIDALDLCDREDALLDEVAATLSRGAVVGWFHGRMEFGPRALGARSILADPRRPEMRERVNELVKKREGFRPFAPAVLDECRAEHFELDHASPFMVETCQVSSPLSLPAITHVDGSARVQTVTESTNPRFWRLLKAFERRTGCPILLNTSFNLRGEPIVCSPVDALICFAKSGLDALVLEDYLVKRAALPDGWIAMLTELQSTPASAITHTVYTLV